MLYLIPMLEPSVLCVCVCVCFSCIHFAHSCCFDHGYVGMCSFSKLCTVKFITNILHSEIHARNRSFDCSM